MLAGRALFRGVRSTSLAFPLTCHFNNTCYGAIQCATYATVNKSKPKTKPKPTPTTKKSTPTKQSTAVKQGKKVGKLNSKKIVSKKQQVAVSTTSQDTPPKKASIPSVTFKRKRRRRANTAVMARAARAYSRHQRRLAGDRSVGPSTAEEEVLVEMYQQTEGHTIQVSREEFEALPEKLSFEQLYRRILRSFEDHRLPERELLFEMLNKAGSQEDWDNFVIIAKVYQSKLLVMKPHQASHLVHLAIKKGFLNQLFDEMQKNIFYVYPSKAGYHKLIMELAKTDQLDKVWKALQLMAEREIQPARETFNLLIAKYKEDVDTALKLFKTSSALGVRTGTLNATILGGKLAAAGRWNDVLEVEKIVKKDNPSKVFRKAIALIFVNAHLETGDKEGASQLVKAHKDTIQEDIQQLTDADKQAFPFISSLVDSSIPQLASA
eukprot:Phypoly_transcript_08442.p1 GENE.Phypoly_transcript_08442~~Phypoly_transcript_08442.p1  ORF type:complete len:436 (+),score=79.66 Phypoly_transcript_08442:101-1408(+)